MGRFDVVALGRCCVDDICLVPRLPPKDGKERASSYGRSCGGQAATTAVGLAKLGLKVAFVGRIGDDPEGLLILEDFLSYGVSIEGVQIQRPGMSHRAFIWVEEESGARTVTWVSPEYLEIDPSALSPALITDCRLLHLDGHDAASLAAARLAKEEGSLVSLDLEDPAPWTEELLGLADVVVADSAYGQRAGLGGETDEILTALAAGGARIAAVTRGTEGVAALLDGKVRVDVPAARAETVDTTGAGDAFRSGLIFGLLHEWEWTRSLQMGAVVAALSTEALGGRAGLPTLDEALNHLDGGPSRTRVRMRPLDGADPEGTPY